MENDFPANFFINNRNRLRQELNNNTPIIISSNGLLQRNSDVTYPFRQDSNFWYLTGIAEPDTFLVINGDEEYLVVAEREGQRAVFDGTVDLEKLSISSGIKTVLGQKSGQERMVQTLKQAKHYTGLTPLAGYIKSHGFHANPARSRLAASIKKLKPGIELIDIKPLLTNLRAVKQPEEIKALRRSIDITIQAMGLIRKNFANYHYEYEIEADITAFYRKNNTIHAYQPIVASGKNACILHYISNYHKLLPGMPVLIDTGAEYAMYAADITRTFAISPSKRHLQIAEAVEAVQEFAMSLLKPGVIMKDYENQVEQFLGEKLKYLGLIKSMDKQSIRRYCPHAVSHFLGLDVHDVGTYDKPLKAGMVLTVEPGVYIPEEGFGVRIEDNVLVNKQGIEVLSKLLPKGLA